MTVYIEYAFLENFMLDGLLLYLSVRIARGKIKALRLMFAAAVGAGEAIAFPLLTLPVWSAYFIKLAGGAILVLIAVSGKRVKTYLFAMLAFFLCTFALGGLLTTAYSFFGAEYEAGNGFLVERAPVALVFSAAGLFAVFLGETARRFYRFAKTERKIVDCVLTQNGRTVRWKGLADSGNLLEFHGRGVCVCSAKAIFALFGRDLREVGRIRINTANGGRESPVFECAGMRAGKGAEQAVLLTVGEVESKHYSLILHTDYLEGKHETVERAQSVIG
ncbi:MAG: sigma-E processing peptidase SpoIIGA [Clostridia bacterium]|nr:sigma-E processing peptidase SpoIIGA [Clostridia bacterium]